LYAVTVNFRSEAHLGRLIESLRPIKTLRKLIIVDHSDSPDLGALEAEFPVQVVRQANLGYGAGVNRGVREIPEDDAVIMVCNPDLAVLTPEVIPHLMEFLTENPSVGCAAPALVDEQGMAVRSCRKFYTWPSLLASRIPWLRSRPPAFLREHFYMDEGKSHPMEVDWVSGSAMFFRKSLFPAVGPFDERFFLYFEDVDLCASLWKRGLSVVYFPAMICRHYQGRQSHRSMYFLFLHVVSLLRYIAKHGGLVQRKELLLHTVSPSGRTAGNGRKALE